MAPAGCAVSIAVLELFAELDEADLLMKHAAEAVEKQLGWLADKDRLIASQAERIAHQSELLSRSAERNPAI